VDPRTGLDTEARGKILSPLPGIEPRSPGRPARSQTFVIGRTQFLNSSVRGVPRDTFCSLDVGSFPNPATDNMAVNQGVSNCGTRTASGTPVTVQWYTGFVRKNQRIKIN
jgi:hypothetical protein